MYALIFIWGLLLTWRLHSADKTKMHPKAKLQNASTFTGNGSHCHERLLLVNLYLPIVCKRQSANTNVLISWYQLSAKWLIIGQYRLLADYWCTSTCNAYFSCDLDLAAVTLIYELNLDIKNEVSRSKLSQVKAQTAQTDRHDQTHY